MHLTQSPDLPHTPVELALLVFQHKIAIPDGFLRHKGSVHAECAGILVKSMRDIYKWERSHNVDLGKEGLFSVMNQAVEAAGIGTIGDSLEIGELVENARHVAHRAKNLLSAGQFTVPPSLMISRKHELIPRSLPI